MRGIKFRAWDTRTEQMFEYEQMLEAGRQLVIFAKRMRPNMQDIENAKGGLLLPTDDENLIFMQYTGLKDKNGKEIYEGDILRFPPKDWREERDFIGYEVFYHDNDCADNHVGFQMNRLRFYGNLCGGECRAKMLPKYTSQMEIICNIHSNPEMLEVKA